jgi:hypothetical protein
MQYEQVRWERGRGRLASFDKEGKLSWNAELVKKIKMLAGKE